MHAAAIALPADELFTQKTHSDHHELHVEPLVVEPEKQIGAEDNGNRPKAEAVAAAPRPSEQHAEGVGEQDLPR